MDVNLWGPAFWHVLHTITFDYPEHPTPEEHERYSQFFHSLKYVLPCGACRKHFAHGIETKYPIEPALKNRDTLSRWLVDFHNTVNKRLDKPVVTYDSVLSKYESMRGKCGANSSDSQCSDGSANNRTNILLYCVVCLLILMVLVFAYYFPKLRHKL